MDKALRLVMGYQLDDPRLHECITMICEQVSEITLKISPILEAAKATVAPAVVLIPPDNFRYSFASTVLRLQWDRPNISGILSYEVRMGEDWDTALFILRTQSTSVDLAPFSGLTATFLIKTLNVNADYSLDFASVNVLVVPPSAVNINAQVIDNNVLLQWSVPAASYQIDYYQIKRENVLIGTIRGTFTSVFEMVSGLYEYEVIAFDIAGNVGASAVVELQVAQPPDYVLQEEFTSVLDGTRDKVLLMPGPKLLASVPAETWQNHFTSRFWLDPEDQMTAGYPIYIQPAEINGYYEETIDFGAALQNIIATVRFNTTLINPSETVNILVQMRWSTDDITYTAYTDGASQFIDEMRYLRIKISFTGENDKALVELFNLQVFLTVKRENDGGEEIADEDDATGTEVFFNKDFKDIESVTATVKAPVEPFTVVVDFADVPNPVSFKVYVFDSTGNRSTQVIEWKARGIV